jgi:hypothetical protein
VGKDKLGSTLVDMLKPYATKATPSESKLPLSCSLCYVSCANLRTLPRSVEVLLEQLLLLVAAVDARKPDFETNFLDHLARCIFPVSEQTAETPSSIRERRVLCKVLVRSTGLTSLPMPIRADVCLFLVLLFALPRASRRWSSARARSLL